MPLARSHTYRLIIEVTGPIESFASHGAAWEVHRENAVPHALGVLSTARQAQKFIEKSFYDGRAVVAKRVLAIPVRAVAWLDS